MSKPALHPPAAQQLSPQPMPLNALLNQLSHELGALQLMAADMEASVDDMIERHAAVLDARSIQNLQLLDILNQTLLALSQFAANAAQLSARSWEVDGPAAVRNIKLASLAQRLARAAGEADSSNAGSCEMFSS